jgi:TRAP-type C4-dicarboxylate transport system permease small subunit
MRAMKPPLLHRLDDALYAIERTVVIVAMSLMVLMVFFDVVDRRLEAPESKLAGLMTRFHVPAPQTSGAIFGGALLWFLIWFGIATVRRRRNKALVPVALEPLAALGGTVALFALGWIMLHRPSNEFYTIIWLLLCGALFSGQLRKRDTGQWRSALLVLPAAAFGAFSVWRLVPEGYSWAKEVAMVLLVWTGLVGASMAAHQGRHIDIDFGKKMFPKKMRRPLTALASVITSAFCGLIVAIGIVYVFGERGLIRLEGKLQHTGIPDWIVGLAIPWCFATMGLRALMVAKRVLGGAVDAKSSSLTAVQKGLGDH